MRYIDKKNEEAANLEIDNYLKTAKEKLWFKNYKQGRLYKGFRRTTQKKDLINNVLLPEQQSCCCYCMRKLDVSSATIEHIIPQSIPKGNQMQAYFHLEFKGLNAKNICHTEDYVKGKSEGGQYPHEVAYHNFAIACKKCNNTRGNYDIVPMFLFPDIEQNVTYDTNTGEITWVDDPAIKEDTPTQRPTVEKIGLNSPSLKAIRAVWFYSSKHELSISVNTNRNDRSEIIYLAFGEALRSSTDFTVQDLQSFLDLLTDECWTQLCQYDYFKNM
ncbi:MAG: hypothetical protein ACI3Z9_06205 [Candidatus Onthomorpha sp.]